MENKPNLMSFFTTIEDTMIFTGELCKVKIPLRYQVRDLLEVAADVKTLAIFEVIINEKYTYGFLLPAIIRMEPSKVSRTTENGIDYQVCEFVNGDKFMLSTTILREPFIATAMYEEFIVLGRLPSFMDYETTAKLFDTVEKVCNINLHAPHVVWEMIYAHLFRDENDLSIKYRFTEMKNKPVFIGTSNVAFGPDSTTSKLIGAYFNDGVNSALINASEQQYDLEDLLRK